MSGSGSDDRLEWLAVHLVGVAEYLRGLRLHSSTGDVETMMRDVWANRLHSWARVVRGEELSPGDRMNVDPSVGIACSVFARSRGEYVVKGIRREEAAGSRRQASGGGAGARTDTDPPSPDGLRRGARTRRGRPRTPSLKEMGLGRGNSGRGNRSRKG